MLTLLASVMKKCIRQKERHRSTFSLLIFQSPLKLWDSNVHGRIGYLYSFQSDHMKKLNSKFRAARGQGFSWLVKNTFAKDRQNLWVTFPGLLNDVVILQNLFLDTSCKISLKIIFCSYV